jgi:peptide deformylase
MLDVVRIGADILARKAEPLLEFNDALKETIAHMFEAMARDRGIGLAAPQVGIGSRFFVVSIDGDQPRFFANPEIVMTSEEQVDYEEGCLSIPGVYAKVKRSAFVKVQAYNERGRPFVLEADGLLARVILHENDHLNGVLFVDRLGDAKRARLLAEYERRLRI